MANPLYLHTELNTEQHQALQQRTGTVIINAGPGTGKTKTLTARIAHLLHEHAVPAETILALTFTQKAATQMRERLAQLLPDHNKLPTVTTFHAFAYGLLQQEKKSVSVIKDEGRNDLLKKVCDSMKEKITQRELSLLITRYKSSLEKDTSKAVQLYDTLLSSQGLMDFDDMLLFFLQLLEQDSLLRERIQRRYHFIHVDEFQDTNNVQYRILQHLLPPQNNLFVIGDPLQSIYSFRGANADIFEIIARETSVSLTLRLSTNYRSGKSIIAAGSALFPETPVLAAATKEAGTVSLIETFNEFTEADWIVKEICSYMGGIDLNQATHATNLRFSDFAVIYRTHALARVLEQRFAESALPYQVIGSNSLYEQKEITFIIAWLYYLHFRTQPYLDEVKKCGPMPFTNDIQALLEKEALHQPVSSIVRRIIDLFHLKDAVRDKPSKLRNLNQFIGNMVQFDTQYDSLAQAVSYLTYLKEHEYYDPQGDKVTLMTIHAAKGLEFTNVFICGLEDGIIPLRRKQEETDLEEEKRLLYVAMTRAKQRLTLLKARYRNRQKTGRSPFEGYLTPAGVERRIDPIIEKITKKVKRTAEKRSQMTLF